MSVMILLLVIALICWMLVVSVWKRPIPQSYRWVQRMKLYVTKFRIVETRYSATSDLYEFAVQRQEFGLFWRTEYSTGLKCQERGLQSANGQLTYILNRMENAAFPIKRIVAEVRSINELRKDPNEQS